MLWEVLAGNIIHCEVETREELKELASSSKAPTLSSDQRTWGGDQGHWIALRELGNLAMLSNTLETGEIFTLLKRMMYDKKVHVSGDSLCRKQVIHEGFMRKDRMCGACPYV